jgi:hypothetical protein
MEFKSESANQRYNMIRAAITAWALASSPENCRSSGSASGHCPFMPEKVLKGRWVFELNAEIQKKLSHDQKKVRHFLSINEKVLTDIEEIVQITDSLKANVSLMHLIEFPFGLKYSEIVSRILTHPTGNVFVLTRIPPYFPLNGTAPIRFD